MKTDGSEYMNVSFVIGLCLAVLSSFFIGSSFIIKKIALKKICVPGNIRASAGGFAYLKQWIWWLGLFTMGIGELSNFLAYAFAPASLVTPLGALSVLVAAILSSKFLHENLNVIGKIGCLLCVVGSVIFVIHAPKTEEIETFNQLIDKLLHIYFLSYIALMIVMSLILKIVFVPKFGNTNITIYLIMCSALGSLTVVFGKAIALGVKESISGGTNNFFNGMLWLLVLACAFCIMIQLNYLNKSLDIFNTSIVTPVYYVMFTVLVLLASGILFNEWEHMAWEDVIGCLCGFLVVMIAVFMLNAFKDVKMTMKDLNVRTRNIQDVEQNQGSDYGILNVRNYRQS